MTTADGPQLDIVIPVWNEGSAFVDVLDALRSSVHIACFRVLVCYDSPDDTTLECIKQYPASAMHIQLVLNRGKGVHSAILTGFDVSTAPAVLVYPGDDTFNAGIIDSMYAKFQAGCDLVAASRFIPGGCMKDCPWLKALLVRTSAFALHHFARIPTHDPTNGFRLFARRVLERIPVESQAGFTYSIELLVKTHRLRWKICEVPAQWFERKHGTSRFRVLRWLPAYLRWFLYAFETTYLRRGPRTVGVRASKAAPHG